MRAFAFTLACLAAAAAARAGQEEGSSYVRPSLYLLGTSEHGRGPAYEPPSGLASTDDAASAALGLDAFTMSRRGRIEVSAFALAHDPLSAGDRGWYATGRARAALDLGDGGWRLRVEESPRLQRRHTASLSDFERNDLSIALDPGAAAGATAFGFRVADRRRTVHGDANQGFDRQTLAATLEGGGWPHRWRLEAGPQRFATSIAESWRMTGALELTGRWAGTSLTARLAWIEPLHETPTGTAASSLAAPATPTALPPIIVTVPVAPTPEPDPRTPIASAPAMEPSIPVPSREGLLGPGLVVDPLESDESDWNLGRRTQEIVLVAARRIGSIEVSTELRALRERGPDFVDAGPEVRREWLAARLHLRKALGRHLALTAQGGWQHLEDDRPGLGFSHGIVSFGLQLQP
jgi:hypothetical protein